MPEGYIGYGSVTSVRILARVYMIPPQTRRQHKGFNAKMSARRKEIYVRGWRYFFYTIVPFAKLTLRVNSKEYTLYANRVGVVDETIDLSLSPGWHEAELISQDDQRCTIKIFIVHPKQSVGVISDIDDTVMVTSLPRPLLAAWNTFVLDEHARAPVPGMNVLYTNLLKHYTYTKDGEFRPPFIYLSTGSWNTSAALYRFLARNLYPHGPLILTDWSPSSKKLFRSGLEHKKDNFAKIVKMFPNIKWILIGDDGQKDVEAFSHFAKMYPSNLQVVIIRQLSHTESVLAGKRAFVNHQFKQQYPVVYGYGGAEILRQLAEKGILRVDTSINNFEDLWHDLSTEKFSQPDLV